MEAGGGRNAINWTRGFTRLYILLVVSDGFYTGFCGFRLNRCRYGRKWPSLA